MAARQHGRAVPISVPLSDALSPNVRVLKNLRKHQSQLLSRLQNLAKLDATLFELSDEPRWDALVPLSGPSTSSTPFASAASSSARLGYGRGQIVSTNTVTINLGCGGGDGDRGYWVEYSAKQARGVVERKRAVLQQKLARVQSAMKEAETALSEEMGFAGGGVNEKFEVLNEEGLPFVEIQEFEEDEQTVAPSTSTARTPNPDPEPSVPVISTSAPVPSFKGKEVDRTPLKYSAGKKVSFAETVKTQSAEDDLPVIYSEKAAAAAAAQPAATLSSSVTPPLAQSRSGESQLPLKDSIIERDIKAPPPVLTAAERSVNRINRKDIPSIVGNVGVFEKEQDTSRTKKTALDAYLPKQLRGQTERIQDTTGGQRATDEGDVPEDDEDPYSDSIEDDDDSEGFYNYSEDDEEDEDNLHIDDVLALREAALEYHAKRYDLGAGRGTGALGGDKRPDEYEEPGLSKAELSGLPFIERYDTPDGVRPPSRFRTGRLQHAQMVIPTIQPGQQEAIDEAILPGDSLGPFEHVDGGTGEVTNDFQGMNKEEIETFLRYVKALETGEELDDLSVIPKMQEAEEQQAHDVAIQARPPAIKDSVKPVVTEKPMIEKAVETAVLPQAPAFSGVPVGVREDKPKRVSRFRAAKET